jgi:hypothetical protein
VFLFGGIPSNMKILFLCRKPGTELAIIRSCFKSAVYPVKMIQSIALKRWG